MASCFDKNRTGRARDVTVDVLEEFVQSPQPDLGEEELNGAIDNRPDYICRSGYFIR